MTSRTSVGPHEFEPLSRWDIFRRRPRCRACYLERQHHPVQHWTRARPIGDKRPPYKGMRSAQEARNEETR